MKIENIDGMSPSQINHELRNGAKFVMFQFCISVIILSFKRGSKIYLIKSGESTFRYGLPYTLISLFLGWWGIPWGPIYTLQSFYINLRGGKDVTNELSTAFNQVDGK